MKNLRRLGVTLTVLVLAFLCLTVVRPVNAAANENNTKSNKTYTCGNYEYVLVDSAAKITRYIGTDKEVTIPEKLDGHSVKIIDGDAFYGDRLIEKVTISASIEQIEDSVVDENEMYYGAFSNCVNLKEVVFSKKSKLSYIGRGAFDSCSKLEKITLPSSIREIGEGAFGACVSLKKLTLPEGLLRLGQAAFTRTSIQTLHIPASCTDVHFVNNAVTLMSVTVADDNPRYRSHEGVLYELTEQWGWTLVIYPANKPSAEFRVADFAQTIYGDAFIRAFTHPMGDHTFSSNLQKIYIGDCNVVDYCGNSMISRIRCTVIPDDTNPYFKAVNGMVLSKDGKTLEQMPSYLEGEVTIPDGVERIADYAGEKGQFTKLVFPESVDIIGSGSFWDCVNLEEVVFPSKMKEIGGAAFQSCVNLDYVIIPEGIKNLYLNTFQSCHELKFAVLPDSMKQIEWQAFNSCGDLTYVFYNGSKTEWENVYVDSFGNDEFCNAKYYYGNNCFEKNFIFENGLLLTADGKTLVKVICSQENLVIPEGVTTIADRATFFKQDLKCTSLYLPDSLTKIGEYAFVGYDNLENLYIPKNVTDIGYGAFGTDNMARVVIDGNIANLKEYTFSCEEIFIPKSVKKIDSYAFPWVKTVYYEGTKSQWNKIEKGDMNEFTLKCDVTSMVAIRREPEDIQAKPGKKVSVKVEAVGEGLKYQWYTCSPGETSFKKSSITSATYTCEMTSDVNGRQAYCVVTDKYGYKIQSRTVTLKATLPISVRQLPNSVFAGENETLKLSVDATGNGLTYQWYVCNPGKTTFSESSIKKAEYSCKMTESTSGRKVYCEVSDKDGNKIKTNTVMLCMGVPMQMVEDITSYDVLEGTTARAEVHVAGSDLTYTWYVSRNNGSSYSKSSNSGPAYTCKMTGDDQSRLVYCVIQDKFGNQIVSSVCSLSNIKVTEQPEDKCVEIGKTVKTSVKVKHTHLGGWIEYQWYVKNPGSKTFVKTEQTGRTYSVKMKEKISGQQVYCLLIDATGNTVKSETAVLSAPVTITQQPSNTYVQSGKTAKVSVEASGGGLTYQWYIKNAGGTKYSKSSATSATYSCKMNEKSKDRYVYCVVTDKFGNTAKSKTIVIREAVSIVTEPENGYAQLDKNVKVTLKASGDGLKYEWYFKNAGSENYSKSSITSASYSAKMSDKVNGRQVYCVVTDKYGKTVQSKTVLLRMAATITTQPKSVTAAEGKTAKVTVTAIGDGLTYQWYIKNPGKTKFSQSSVTGATYSCKMSESTDGREVYCVITDKYGISVQTKTVKLSLEF